MMNIEVKKQYNIINPFAIDLPDLVVLTGENGSGKTQLLNYIAAATGAFLDEEVQGNMPEPFYITEMGEEIPSLIITNEDKQSNLVIMPGKKSRQELVDGIPIFFWEQFKDTNFVFFDGAEVKISQKVH